MLEDTIFQSAEGRGTALVLNVVSNASIVRSAFLSNTNGSRYEHYIHFSAGLEHQYNFESANLTYGGALYTASSNVTIDDSNFNMNRAQVGGAIAVLDGKISISNSQFANNNGVSDLYTLSAEFGGVIATSESSFNITNSTITNNSVTYGGVISYTVNKSAIGNIE